MSLTAYPTLRLKLTMPQALKLQFLPAVPGFNATQAANKVNRTGDTMTGSLILAHDPAVGLEAATKQYVDAHSGGGINLNASQLAGRGAASGTGTPEAITLGTNLSMSGTTLNATGGSGGGNVSTSGAITTGLLAQWTDATHIKSDNTLIADLTVNTAAASEQIKITGAAAVGIKFNNTGGPRTGYLRLGGTALEIVSDVASVMSAELGSGIVNFPTASPTGPTPTAGDSTQKLATTAFVTAAVTSGGGVPTPPQGRLTLTTGVAVTKNDVTGANQYFYTPAVGQYLPLWNGTSFVMTDFGGELTGVTTDATKSPAAVIASKMYYVLVWMDGSTPRVSRSPAWTSDTVVGTGAGSAEVEFLKGIPVNKVAITNGPAARRGIVVGVIRSDASSLLRDQYAFRWCTNVFNVDDRILRRFETAGTWTQTSASNTFFQANNGNTANQLDVIQPFDGVTVSADVLTSYMNTNGSTPGPYGVVKIDVDAVASSLVTDNLNGFFGVTANNTWVQVACSYIGKPGIGRHTLIWCELHNTGSGVSNWLGTGGGPLLQGGMIGRMQG